MSAHMITDARILVVDDQDSNVQLLDRLLRMKGYTHIETLTDSRQVVDRFVATRPDLVCLDLRMPHLSGLETRFLYLQLRAQNERLDQKVRERTREIEEAQHEILGRLALAAEYRDDQTGEHTRRVGHLAALLARELGLSDAEVELIRQAAPLHDIGTVETATAH